MVKGKMDVMRMFNAAAILFPGALGCVVNFTMCTVPGGEC